MEYEVETISNSGTLKNGKISIAVSNIHITEDNILSSAIGTPVLSTKRYEQIRSLLNSILASSHKVDILILPEVSIPHSYLPLMQRFCRQNQIGLIFGLEHRLIPEQKEKDTDIGTAHNHIVTLLPFIENKHYKCCITYKRLKRHYAPGEAKTLTDNRVCIPSLQEPYHLFHWRECYFTVFNCYELANVEDRAQFRSKIDFMAVAEWNKDTNYFSNIAESAARDLHCYFIQVNTSQFGDSRIIKPAKTEQMNILRTMGGKNETVLIQEIDIASLRNFQKLSQAGQMSNNQFKFTPPNYSYAEVERRINNEEPLNPS